MKYRGVEGGTVSGPPLCRSCRRSTYMRGPSIGQEVLYCHNVGEPLPFEVYECTSYDDKSQPSLADMQRTAWILRTDEFKTSIGFVSPAQWARSRKAKEIQPWEDIDIDP